MDKRIDLGLDHIYEPVEYRATVAAANILHKRPDGTDCVGGWVPFTGKSWAEEMGNTIATWDIVTEDPLTLSPSILCTQCGDHGFIENGVWVPA